ncbi:antiviral reverse transcriptase Drt3a [Colwellia sp. MB02u-9]|uniref:antiviral reverse transcriptase Drt3a n=1 Tax=Colwellia sp. MB02u-9 TaxID=2759823 RepID=UPI0015F414B4|nr:antiviral reverse transcriptase Drt3a [Colwellia sp. MB02u-9]MBA6296589.1 RNA-directed DNA polymerase [Colwellia sp. MB02u-9]
MLNQSINEKNLKLLKGRTFQKFLKGNDSESAFTKVLDDLNNKLSDSAYAFDDFVPKMVNGKPGYDCANPEDELVLKKLNDNIKRLFKVKTSDRHAIVKQTISLLQDSQPISIIRLDIKHFYENIDRNKIISFVNNEWLLSHQNRMILKSFNESSQITSTPGLPRGLSISSTLSELGLRKFDSKVRKIKDVYFYGRFVDDMVIFCTKNPGEIIDEISDLLTDLDLNLEFNDKTFIFNAEADNKKTEFIDYLGYKIKFETSPEQTKPRELTVQISDKKIHKIKDRLHKSFRSYLRTRTFDLLLARLKFLTGNQYIIGDIDRTKLKSGIYYNYPLLTTNFQLKQLDTFYQKLIISKAPHIEKSMSMIKKHNSTGGVKKNSRLQQIQRMSFSFGFEQKIMNSFDRKISRKIKGCW